MTIKTEPFIGQITGSGMLARAFLPFVGEGRFACIYAAGVSNSCCTNEKEFERERVRLTQALMRADHADPFIYFGTCSVADPEVNKTPYVQHKLAMECLVKTHPQFLIFRLPQVVGHTPNPHTLLNFLYARIVRSERFSIWKKAFRNVIDVQDVVAIARQFIINPSFRNVTVNIANPVNYSVRDIVKALERAAGQTAVYDVLDCGFAYSIDVHKSVLAAKQAGVVFSNSYLDNVICKYYGHSE